VNTQKRQLADTEKTAINAANPQFPRSAGARKEFGYISLVNPEAVGVRC
jgi:hypothetical protein